MSQDFEVYHMVSSKLGENRPSIDSYRIGQNMYYWAYLMEVAAGTKPVSDYEPVKVLVKQKTYAKWDMYSSAAYYPIVSQRFVDVLGHAMTEAFELLDFYINDTLYHHLRCRKKIDCVDMDKSELSYMADGNLNNIERAVFKTEMLTDPMLFSVPERATRILATPQVLEIAKKAKLKGVYFETTDGKETLVQ